MSMSAFQINQYAFKILTKIGIYSMQQMFTFQHNLLCQCNASPLIKQIEQ